MAGAPRQRLGHHAANAPGGSGGRRRRRGAARGHRLHLRPGEDPTSAVLREVREEFGAPLPLVARLGVLELEAHLPHTPAGARPFVAHFFLLEGGDHVPGPVPEEGIDAWRAVPLAELPTAAARLRALRPNTAPNGWMLSYWGAFRALEHEVASHFLIAYRAPGSSGRREPAPGTAEPGTAPPGTPPAPGTPPTGTADHAP
ncbi:MAG TPA: NUDIX domain-containing protein [Chloroflexota bacterium]|nr:NUDIX domain-containing protein [Chloroflexota bacterium]